MTYRGLYPRRPRWWVIWVWIALLAMGIVTGFAPLILVSFAALAWLLFMRLTRWSPLCGAAVAGFISGLLSGGRR